MSPSKVVDLFQRSMEREEAAEIAAIDCLIEAIKHACEGHNIRRVSIALTDVLGEAINEQSSTEAMADGLIDIACEEMKMQCARI